MEREKHYIILYIFHLSNFKIFNQLNNFQSHAVLIFIGTCEECGRFIELTGNRTIYCKSCAKIKKNEQIKEIMREKRNVIK